MRHFRITAIYGVPSTYHNCISPQNAPSNSLFYEILQKSLKIINFQPKTSETACFGNFQQGEQYRITPNTIHSTYETSLQDSR